MTTNYLAWISQALELVQLYRNGYAPHDVADGLLEKYRQWDVPEKYRLSEIEPQAEPDASFEEWWTEFRKVLPPTTDPFRNSSFCQLAEAGWNACKAHYERKVQR